MIFAIDPGPETSAFLAFDGSRVLESRDVPNEELVHELRTASHLQPATLAVEFVQSYGMAVGKDVFETVFWIGRFVEAWESVESYNRKEHVLVFRKDVKLHLCRSTRAKDANVRQAIIDRYPRTGGGKTPQVGTKKEPGPLFGVKGHAWSALAVAIYANDTRRGRIAA